MNDDTRSAVAVSTEHTSELHEAARQAYRDSLDQGSPLTGKSLGAMFDHSERWGQLRAAEARAEAAGREDRTNSSVAVVRNGAQPLAGRINGAAGSASAATATVTVAQPPMLAEGPATAQDAGGDQADPARVAVAHQDVGVHPEVPVWVERVTVVAVLAVALAAGIASIDHLAELARLAGTEGWRAWLLPASLDGLVVASSMCLYRAHLLARPAGWLPWASLLSGLLASVAGNVLSVYPELVPEAWLKIAVGGSSPVALALSFDLLLRQARTTT